MSNAANEASVIVPVVRLDQAFQLQLDLEGGNGSDTRSIISLDTIWTTIIRQNAWSDRIALVVLSDAPSVTDNIADIRCSRNEIAIETWGGVGHSSKVLACDSVLGLATLHLRFELNRIGPEFSLEDLVKKVMDEENPLHEVGIMYPSKSRAYTHFALRFGPTCRNTTWNKCLWRGGRHVSENARISAASRTYARLSMSILKSKGSGGV